MMDGNALCARIVLRRVHKSVVSRHTALETDKLKSVCVYQNVVGGCGMPYQLRPLRLGDLRCVTDIYNTACNARESTEGTRSWSVAEMKKFLFQTRPVFESYLCSFQGAVVGWAAFTRYRVKEDVEHAAEMSLYVKEQFRRRGIGTALAHTLLNRAHVLDLHCIFSVVFKDRPYVVSFAEKKCGFSIAGCIPEVFSDRGKCYDVLFLEKLVKL